WITLKEAKEMAKFLEISAELFMSRYTRRLGGRLALLEDQKNYDCIFLEKKICKVYAARPKQCRTFPFWKDNLRSKETWEEAASQCEGIDHPNASLISLEKIEEVFKS
ncbi:MAG: YkgJ family cysteine cluster protein, partial [Anaerolineae bacterium]